MVALRPIRVKETACAPAETAEQQYATQLLNVPCFQEAMALSLILCTCYHCVQKICCLHYNCKQSFKIPQIFDKIFDKWENKLCTNIYCYKLTIARESQLSTGHIGIRSSPEVITHCAPGMIVANLHTTFTWQSSTSESDVSIRTH